MPLTKPALATVSPGQPVTAQGWNAIVGGVGDLFDALLALGTGVLEVSVVSGEQPVRDAQLVAAPQGEGLPLPGLPPHGEEGNYTIAGLTPGQWRVFVQAPGHRPETRTVTIPATEPLVVPLTLAGVRVPDLFGRSGQEAFAMLNTAGLAVDLVLDVLGHEVSRAPLPAQYQNQPILLQLPAAGTVVDPATQRMRLVIAAAIEQAPVVTMPNLVGLTNDEVAAVLNRLGLVLGRTTVRRATLEVQ
jgi:hypothetical protein